MCNILISEFERMFKRKKTGIVLIVYFITVLLQGLFIYMVGGISFYDPDQSVQLNSINTAPFFLRELGLLINFVLIPMFVIDSFNGEYHSGALRLVLTRPIDRMKLFIAKWIVQASLFFMVTIITWLIATVYGKLWMSSATETAFYQTKTMNQWEGFFYTLTFYGVAYLIFLCVIGLCSLLSVILPNPIITYIATIGCLIGAIYISDQFIYFISISDSIFSALGNTTQLSLLFHLFLLFVFTFIMNISIWRRRQWVG